MPSPREPRHNLSSCVGVLSTVYYKLMEPQKIVLAGHSPSPNSLPNSTTGEGVMLRMDAPSVHRVIRIFSMIIFRNDFDHV